MRIDAAIPILMGTINMSAEKLRATWWAATVVEPKGASNNATTANKVTSNSNVMAMGRPSLKVRFMATTDGL